MGLLNDRRPEALIAAAAKAHAAGEYFICPVLAWPTAVPHSTMLVGDWQRIIHALEAQGWMLTQWSVRGDREPTAFPVFRRR